MKNLIFLFLIILMIFTKTGNVLSDTSIFTVNNIEINTSVDDQIFHEMYLKRLPK